MVHCQYHSRCDNIGRTLTIIKVKNNPNIFGGYTEATWDGDMVSKSDKNSFIFSLINNENSPMKIKYTNLEQMKQTASCVSLLEKWNELHALHQSETLVVMTPHSIVHYGQD